MLIALCRSLNLVMIWGGGRSFLALLSPPPPPTQHEVTVEAMTICLKLFALWTRYRLG